jgi:hypothetical protein
MAGAEQPQAQVTRRIAERERLADERELLADERERLADDREVLADQRDAVADELDRLGLGPVPAATAASGARGSRLRVLESERGLESARATLTRSRALLARNQLAVGIEDNSARQQELAIAREMLATRVTADRRTTDGTHSVP